MQTPEADLNFQTFAECYKDEMHDKQAWYFSHLTETASNDDYTKQVKDGYAAFIKEQFEEFKNSEYASNEDFEAGVKQFVKNKVASNKQLKCELLEDVFKISLGKDVLTNKDEALIYALESNWDATDIAPKYLIQEIQDKLTDVIKLTEFFDEQCKMFPLIKKAWEGESNDKKQKLQGELQDGHRSAQCVAYLTSDETDLAPYQDRIRSFIISTHLSGLYPQAKWRHIYKDSLVDVYMMHKKENETFTEFVAEVEKRLSCAPEDYINREINGLKTQERKAAGKSGITPEQEKTLEKEIRGYVVYFCRFPQNTLDSSSQVSTNSIVSDQLKHDLKQQLAFRNKVGQAAKKRGTKPGEEGTELTEISGRKSPSGSRKR